MADLGPFPHDFVVSSLHTVDIEGRAKQCREVDLTGWKMPSPPVTLSLCFDSDAVVTALSISMWLLA